MKKILSTLLIVVFISCEPDKPEPINHVPEIIAIEAPSYIQFSDTVRLRVFDADGDAVEIGLETYMQNGTYIQNPFLHFPNDQGLYGDRNVGDKEYTGILNQSGLSALNTSRFYFHFFVRDHRSENGPYIVIISQNPAFGRPPVIGLPVMPDTIVLQSVPVLFSVFLPVSDPDGLEDIRTVFMRSAGSGTPIALYDDGNLADHGDSTARDGIYSRRLQLPPTTPPGVYGFDFRAIDLLELVSNIVLDTIIVVNN